MSRNRLITTGGPNVLALFVACSAITIVVANTDPVNSGSSPGALNAASIFAPTAQLPPAPALPERVQTEQGETQPVSTMAAVSPHLSGPWALKLNTEMLQRGCLSFSQVSDYSATFTKQERIGGVLSDVQDIELKIRQRPLSVYMKWQTGDAGRQLIYTTGKNDGNLLVQPGGIKGRLTGVLALEPTGTMAMAECRYPVTKVGLLPLAQTILSHELPDLDLASGYRCELRNGETFADRPCYLFVCEYDSPVKHPVYRKTVLYIDKELSLPTCVKNFTWGVDVDPARIDEETLVEMYAYTNIQLNPNFGDEHFDETNPDYHLRCKKR